MSPSDASWRAVLVSETRYGCRAYRIEGEGVPYRLSLVILYNDGALENRRGRPIESAAIMLAIAPTSAGMAANKPMTSAEFLRHPNVVGETATHSDEMFAVAGLPHPVPPRPPSRRFRTGNSSPLPCGSKRPTGFVGTGASPAPLSRAVR